MSVCSQPGPSYPARSTGVSRPGSILPTDSEYDRAQAIPSMLLLFCDNGRSLRLGSQPAADFAFHSVISELLFSQSCLYMLVFNNPIKGSIASSWAQSPSPVMVHPKKGSSFNWKHPVPNGFPFCKIGIFALIWTRFGRFTSTCLFLFLFFYFRFDAMVWSTWG